MADDKSSHYLQFAFKTLKSGFLNNCVDFHFLIFCWNFFFTNHSTTEIESTQESVFFSRTAVTNDHNLAGFILSRNVFFHSPIDWRFEIKTSDFRGLDRVLTGPCSPPTALDRIILCLFPLETAPSIPWLVAASFQSLAPSSQSHLHCSLSQLLSEDTALGFSAHQCSIGWSHLIKLMKASFPKKIWLWGLEHGHILCGGGVQHWAPRKFKSPQANHKRHMCKAIWEIKGAITAV